MPQQQSQRRDNLRETPTVTLDEAFASPDNPFTPSLQSIRLPAPALDPNSHASSIARSGSGLDKRRSLHKSPRNNATSYNAKIQSPSFPLTDWSAESPEQKFFSWLNEELSKIQSFYIEKEREATQRFSKIRSQLHEMRDLYHDQREEKKQEKATAAIQNRAIQQGQAAKDYSRRNPTNDSIKPGPVTDEKRPKLS